mmetsp:Transcript_15798/g.34315  ORF Transcript_15798/g.34315 Transcript_15798/m.34315 type:complete len:239 (+) Transcript_15798:378-1094(+)
MTLTRPTGPPSPPIGSCASRSLLSKSAPARYHLQLSSALPAFLAPLAQPTHSVAFGLLGIQRTRVYSTSFLPVTRVHRATYTIDSHVRRLESMAPRRSMARQPSCMRRGCCCRSCRRVQRSCADRQDARRSCVPANRHTRAATLHFASHFCAARSGTSASSSSRRSCGTCVITRQTHNSAGSAVWSTFRQQCSGSIGALCRTLEGRLSSFQARPISNHSGRLSTGACAPVTSRRPCAL